MRTPGNWESICRTGSVWPSAGRTTRSSAGSSPQGSTSWSVRPGRLIDYFKQRVYSFDRVQVMVLDEADRMFDLGFIRDIRYVLRRLPPRNRRLNMLFSATLSHRVLELAYEHMNEPQLVRIEPDKVTVDGVRQCIYFPANEEKVPLLLTLLEQMQARRTMIFVNTRREADRLQHHLVHNGVNARAISGDVPQRKRLRMLRNFLAGELAVLIGTDVASRGLHVPGRESRIQLRPAHRTLKTTCIGSDARPGPGASGDAVSFGCENYAASLPDIEALHRAQDSGGAHRSGLRWST